MTKLEHKSKDNVGVN